MLQRQLISSLNLLHPVSQAYESFIEQERPFYFRTIKKGTLILVPGKKGDELHFVCKGFFILYCYDDRGEEQVLDFFWENTFIMIPVQFYDGTSNEQYYIRAIEDAQLLSISNTKMDIIHDLFPESRIHIDRIRSRITLRTIHHLLLLLRQKEERYSEFVSFYKMIAARLTEYLTSSFLGVCIKTLNRAKQARKPKIRTFVLYFIGLLYYFFA